MTNTTNPTEITITSLEATVELGGILFATVKASIIGPSVGAHIDLDGNILGNLNMVEFTGTDDCDAVVALRRAARRAFLVATQECGFDHLDTATMDAAAVAIARASQFPAGHWMAI